MCFRPSTAEQSLECPECGKKINAVGGRMPTLCPFCEIDISDLVKDSVPPVAKSPFVNQKQEGESPAKPEAPAAPKAPPPNNNT